MSQEEEFRCPGCGIALPRKGFCWTCHPAWEQRKVELADERERRLRKITQEGSRVARKAKG